MRGLLVIATLSACWTGRGEPPRWHASRDVVDLLPDGAWLVAGMNIDTSDSDAQRANEAKARRDPSSLRGSDGSCNFPTSNAAFAAYDHDDLAFVARGAFQRAALLDCLAARATNSGSTATHTAVAGVDVLETRDDKGSAMYAATDSGLFVFASEPIMTEVVAERLRPATSDPHLAPLIVRARKAGDIWIAAYSTQMPFANDVLDAIGVKLDGRVTSIVGTIHFTNPSAFDVELQLDRASDAGKLAAALDGRKQWLVALAPKLKTLVDALAIRSDGARVVIHADPSNVSWTDALAGFLGAIATLRN
jgi:hypothetical protein